MPILSPSIRRPLLRAVDPIMAALTAAAAPIAWAVARAGKNTPLSRAVLDRAGLAFVRKHYYAPVVDAQDIRRPLDAVRRLPGLDLNEEGQRALINSFHYAGELTALPMIKPAIDRYGYENTTYAEGDAEMLYNMIRHFRPRRIVEVGSGQSTLMAMEAVAANRREDAAYDCRVTCIEPFEQPWLEGLGVEVIRERVEDCPDDLVRSLGPNDFFFIDSSHVIRPQGDVLHLYQYLMPQVAPGVIVHVHDVFTPRDYPAKWVIDDRRLWNEQYLMEAFLAFNPAFEVLLAVNWLANDRRDWLAEACPMLMNKPGKQPGAFWMRRKPA
jgi:predicted O-methyltransferase YrrM